MSAFSLFILQMVITPFTISQLPESSYMNSFGYDASSACKKPFARNAKAYFEKLPCDFQHQNWCTVAGKFYPWHAVRRFVQENQGLMRRMYGDEKHILVLKNELEKNDIDLEIEQRNPKLFNNPRFFGDYNQNEDDYQITKNKNQDHTFTEKIPRFHDSTKLHPQYTASSTYPSINTVSLNENSSHLNSTLSTKLYKATAMTESNDKLPNGLNKTDENKENKNSKTTVLLSDIARIKNSSIDKIPDFLSTTEYNILNLTTTNPISSLDIEKTTINPESFAQTSTTLGEQIDSNTDRINKDELSTNEQNYHSPKPHLEHILSDDNKLNNKSQLFQDATKEQTERPVLKLRGINACPVKEEVVAPFWANNTRGEVLALLNLYPFEQYVHWEKCTHEKKQMYCREGCRCEQQYRLHRLLAYDPNNECRGIFSDWFKFPSCCVCRCYDLPIEFRVTSRSPRLQRRKIKIRKSVD
ncbi:protein spaetzle 4 isoform X2 [Cotesia glomerata]|uniref:protein spaetzle 4 isoform X2 n=1 Tax=Cotesia glomerata TaxID=32391 RepID=UPI001D00894D|nr:protein spaetzle 4 isoform X2 [Cotesia glomerata]